MKIKISEKKLSEMIINSVNKYFLSEETQKINEIGPKMTAMALKAGSGIYPETTNNNREKNLFRSPHKIATNAYNKYFEPFIGQTFSVSTNGLGVHEIKIEKVNGAFSNLIIIDGINQNGIKIKTIIDLITFTKELEFSDGRRTKYFSFSENSSLVKRIANASKKLNQYLSEETQKINEIGPKMTAMALKAGSGIYPATTNNNREKNLYRSPNKIATNAYKKYFEPFIGQTFSVSTNDLGDHEIKIVEVNGAFSNSISIDGIDQNGMRINTIIDLDTFTKVLEFGDGQKTKYFTFTENSSIVKKIANASKKLNQYLNAKNESIIKENEFILGEGYTHFAIDKNTNKIVNGWDYNDEDYVFWSNEDIRYYSKLDLNDQFPDRKASDFKIVSRKFLERNGVDVSDGNNWQN